MSDTAGMSERKIPVSDPDPLLIKEVVIVDMKKLKITLRKWKHWLVEDEHRGSFEKWEAVVNDPVKDMSITVPLNSEKYEDVIKALGGRMIDHYATEIKTKEKYERLAHKVRSIVPEEPLMLTPLPHMEFGMQSIGQHHASSKSKTEK